MLRRLTRVMLNTPSVKPAVDMKRPIGTTIYIRQALDNNGHIEVVADHASRLENSALKTMHEILKEKYDTESTYTGDKVEMLNGNLHDVVKAQTEAEARTTVLRSFIGGNNDRHVEVESLNTDVLRVVKAKMEEDGVSNYISKHPNSHFILHANSSKPNFAEETLEQLSAYNARFK